MTWVPHDDAMQAVVALLMEAQVPDTETQMNVLRKLDEYNDVPQFNRYLLYVLSRRPELDGAARALSGLILLNNIRKYRANISLETMNCIKCECLNTVGDPSSLIRGVVGSVIAEIAANGGLAVWPELMPALYDIVAVKDDNHKEGALRALMYFNTGIAAVKDDNHQEGALRALVYFNTGTSEQRKSLIPTCRQLVDSANPIIRYIAKSCLDDYFAKLTESIFPPQDA